MLGSWPTFKDHRGLLVPIEFAQLPFMPKRLFYVSNVPKGEERGNHAHYNTKQILTCNWQVQYNSAFNPMNS